MTYEKLSDQTTIARRIFIVVLVLVILSPVIYRLTYGRSSVVGARGDGFVTLRYMAWGNPSQLATEQTIINLFNKKCADAGKKLRVELFMTPGSGYVQKLQLMMASGTGPDVMRIDHYDFPLQVMRGYFHDLTDLAKSDKSFDADAYHPIAMKENYSGDRLYGLNMLFGGLICYYNRDLFARAGLEDPYDLWKRGEWTWARFEEDARKLTERDANGSTRVYGFIVPQALWWLWNWRNGAQVMNEDRSAVAWDSPGGLEGFRQLHKMVYVDRVCPTPADSAAAAFTFDSGNVAMVFEWGGMSPRYRSAIRDFRWDIVPTPSDRGNEFSLIKGNQVVMNARCKHPEEAWEWMKFLTSAEAEIIMYGDKLRRSLPTQKSVLADPRFLLATQAPYHTDVFLNIFKHGRELPIDPTWSAWTQVLNPQLDRLMLDPKAKPEDFLPQAARDANRAIADERERLKRYER